MRPIDAALLRELAQGGAAAIVDGLVHEFGRQLGEAGIDTPLRAAHFLAQGIYETCYLTRLEEDLNYTEARLVLVWPRLAGRGAALASAPQRLANAAYADVNGNGDEASGDGWRYRGRGLLQLTGRANYALAGLSDDPDSAATPCGAVASARAFWRARKIDGAADNDDIARVTRLVNGGTEGIAERTILKHRALRLLES